MANIRKLQTKTLNQLSLSNSFLYLLNTATNVESRIALSSLVDGSATSVGGGIPIYAGVVNNVLNFKSLQAADSVLNLTTTSTGEITMGLALANLDLSLCKNTTSLFLSTVDLTSNVGSTILPVANGGTGASTLTDGGILLGSGTGAITAMSALAAGTIIQGDGTTDPTTLALGSAGQMLAVNAGATALEYVAAPASSFVALANATLDMANNNIDLGTGAINKDGAGSYGISIDTANRVHLQPDGGSITGGTEALNVSGSIFLQGTSNRNITLGAPSAGNGSLFNINGSNAGTSSSDGGDISIEGGSTTSGTGGNISLYPGASTTGDTGSISLYTRSGASTTFPILRIAKTKRVSIQNSSAIIEPTGLLDVEQTDASGAIPVLRLVQDDQDFALAQFTGTAAADSTKNISTSTATAAAKTGAIKVKIQNGTDTATDAWIRVWASAV
jgi:hypothetical protein